MFLRYRAKGLIFKKEDKGDSDQILKVFTKDFGKLEILGKGIRKISSKLKSGVEIFNLSEIEFIQGKIHKTLTDAIVVEKFKNLKRSLKRLSIAYKISEVMDNLIKGEEKDENIWKLILETFKNLNDPTLSFTICNLQYYYFFWNLISYLGHKPEIYSCVVCQKRLKPKKIYFSSREGGLVCGNCISKIKDGREINFRVVKMLRIILEKSFDFLKKIKLEKEDLRKLEEVSENYFKFLTAKNYETKNF